MNSHVCTCTLLSYASNHYSHGNQRQQSQNTHPNTLKLGVFNFVTTKTVSVESWTRIQKKKETKNMNLNICHCDQQRIDKYTNH